MTLKLKEIIKVLENWAPKSDAEDFDNVGLQVGDPEQDIEKALVTLDITDEVVNQAIEENAHLIITFHPLIFKGLKQLSGKNRIERLVVKAIQHNIALYAIHTNLDAQLDGVNGMIAERLGLEDCKILIPKTEDLFKLKFFVPHMDAEKVKDAIFSTGAGTIGNYAECSFNTEGYGTFKPIKGANPTLGTLDQRHEEPETKVEILIQQKEINNVLSMMKSAHPYEEVAYDLIPLKNENQTKGMGQIGKLKEPMAAESFLKLVKNQLTTTCVRHSDLIHKKIEKVAILGGSGAFAISPAKMAGADAFVTADLKYHDFFLAENGILLCDVGHFESEQYTKNLITRYLSEIFPNFAILTSDINTNPVNYYI
ncbi:Nif3-like dinuclear metal center hexameric protein [Flavobacteriaceae bacterium Ap0902]|nr:Nif3-like dinuclear metal center hexameric protein [Flavobacteriaceae bacterium Ap0902]